MSARRLAVVLLAGVLAVGCGGGGKKLRKPTKVVNAPPVDPEALRHFGVATAALGRNSAAGRESAKESLTAAVKLDDNLWEAWHNLGVIHLAAGDDDLAVRAFAKALAKNGKHRQSRIARAEAYRHLGNSKKARADYEKALAQFPEDAETSARLASLLREAKQYEEALDRLRETLRVVGGSARIYVELGLIYMAQGRTELAELVFRKAAQLDVKEPSIYNAVALLALDRGDAQLAFDRFDHATSLDPDYLAARYNKAAVLLDAGDYASAKRELSIVVDRDHSDFDARVALGVAQRGLEELAEAEKSWQEVASEAPVRSSARGDALFNLAVLEMDFRDNERKAAAALDLYLSEAAPTHHQRDKASERRKELP